MIAALLVACSLTWSSVVAARPAQGELQLVPYQLVILTKGPAAAKAQTPEGQALLKEHVGYLYKLAASGAIVAAGPLTDGGEIQGLIVIDAGTPAQAEAIESADPGIKSGIFRMEPALTFYSPKNWFGKWAEFGKFELVYFGFLKSGPNRGQDAETAKRLQAEHLAYMDGQSKEGRLVVAGPFADAGERRGIVVYRAGSADAAKRYAEGDPMVKVGRLAVELHPWQVPQGALPMLPP
jgi:uncharacterized protein YciI